MAIVSTFIEVLEEGERADHYLDGLQRELRQQAVVGRLAQPTIPLIFFHEPPIEVQHAVVRAALDQVDDWDQKMDDWDHKMDDWRPYLAVTGP